MYDIIGLGGCGIDYKTRVRSFADKDHKIMADAIIADEGGVTADNLVQAARLGMKAGWCGCLGDDVAGKRLLRSLRDEDIEPFARAQGATQCCWIAVDDAGERQIYIFANATRTLTPSIVDEMFADVIRSAKHFHTEAAVIPLAAAIRGAEIAKNANRLVFLDVDGDPEYLINEARLGTKQELQRLFKLSSVIKISEPAALSLYKGPDAAADALLAHARIVAVTLGAQGCLLASKERRVRVPGFKLGAVDTTGAGDAFMGGLSYAVLNAMPLEQTGRFANACGALCASRMGTRSSPTLAEVQELLAQRR